MKKSIIVIIPFLFMVLASYSQIDIRKIAASLNLTSVQINKPEKMVLFGIDKDKISNSDANLYYYHSAIGFGQAKTYLDKNSIELFQSKNGKLSIIYNTGTKKTLTSFRNCYNSIEIDNIAKKANFKDLFEEDKIGLDTLDLLTIYRQKSVNGNNLIECSEILLSINPSIYFFRTYYEIPRTDINGSKYGFNIELVTTNSFLDLYKLLSSDAKNNTANSEILKKINHLMTVEVANIKELSPKGEFETSDQYAQRYKIGEIQKEQIENKYQKLTIEFKQLSDIYKIEKIQNSQEEIILKIENIGNYDADKQMFPITINGTTKSIKVSIEQAKSFKEKKNEIKVIAEKKLENDGETVQISNIKIINPLNGDIIDF